MALGEQNWREAVDVLADLAIIIGALTGGVWTLLTFTTLRSRQRAEAELRNVELNNERQAVINIELKSKQVKLPGHPYYHIETIVNITNSGNTNALLLFRSAPLIVTEAIVTNSGARPCGQVFGALFFGQS